MLAINWRTFLNDLRRMAVPTQRDEIQASAVVDSTSTPKARRFDHRLDDCAEARCAVRMEAFGRVVENFGAM